MKKVYFFTCVFFLFKMNAFAQQITGKVTSASGPIYGANIQEIGTKSSTTSDVTGSFTLKAGTIPTKIKVSFIGFDNQIVEVKETNQSNLEIILVESYSVLDQVVVSASKYQQRLVTTPVTIEKLTAKQLVNSPTANFYEAFTALRGVQGNTGSMVFTSLNTRGFADPNNLRFIQLLDGMDITTPGFGIIGNSAGASSLDIQSMELLPGASSALYGPDAFNGIMLMYTKNPFKNPGFSAELKTGLSRNGLNEYNAYNDLSVRYAHVFNDKWAFKIDANTLQARDWVSADKTALVPVGAYDSRGALLQTTRESNPGFNGVSRYGDGDFGVGVFQNVSLTGPSGASTATITRTGLNDADVYNGKSQNYRLNASLHYKFGNDWEASLTQKMAHNDFSFRITTFYPFENFVQKHTKFEIGNKKFNFRAYHSGQTTNRTYVGFLMANSVETGLKSDANWLADYKANFLTSGNHTSARAFADRDLYGADGLILPSRRNEFDSLKEKFVKSTNPGVGGAGFLDNSSFMNFSADYDLTDDIKFARFQVGANLRRYNVNSEGTFFNDNRADGITGAINFVQYGAFVQATKPFANDRITFVGSLRYDKNQNYNSNLTPRLTLTFGLDKDRNHNIRTSYQTAFRNPGLQESFINFDLFSFLKILGTNQQSIDNFTYTGASGAKYKYSDISPGAKALVPEKNKTFEVGYRGIFNNKILVDLNAYRTEIPNFISLGQVVFKPGEQDFKVFLAYFNENQLVVSSGIGASVDFDLNAGFKVGVNYNYAKLDLPNFVGTATEKAAYTRSLRFNTPENRANVTFGNTGFGYNKALSFNVAFHYSQAYDYQSSFGDTVIPNINYTDLSIGYNIKKADTQITLNATNVFQQDYTLVYGGGTIGSIYTLGFRYTPSK